MHHSTIYAYSLCIAPTCLGAIISTSSGSWHQNLFKAYRNKIGQFKTSKSMNYSSSYKHQWEVI